MNTGLDQLKKAKEEEFFHKEQQNQLQALREKMFVKTEQAREAQERFKNFQEGHSPVTGGKFFKARVGESIVLDCPEEGAMMLTYDSLMSLVKAAKEGNEETLKLWQAFLGQTA